MTELLATFILHPMTLARWQQLILLLPLCLCVSLVYKTIKCSDIHEIPIATLKNWVTVVIDMYVVGAALFVLYEVTTRAF